MSQSPPLQHALDRAVAEKELVATKADALETFGGRLESLSPTRATPESATQTVGGQLTASGGTDRRSSVRTAFAETVEQHVDAESTLGAVQAELGDGVALALAPTTQTTFTPELRQQLLAATRSRQQELGVTKRALEREAEQVEAASETAQRLLDWLESADETPLSTLGFEELDRRHDRLDDWTAELDSLAASRQSFLHSTTSDSGQIGVGNRDLVCSLYEDFGVDYPVLSTVAELTATLEDCRAVVRDHLVRCA
jgi:hypothetical protein